MAQGFQCNCGTASCLGYINGARAMGEANLKGMFLADHVHDALKLNN